MFCSHWHVVRWSTLNDDCFVSLLLFCPLLNTFIKSAYSNHDLKRLFVRLWLTIKDSQLRVYGKAKKNNNFISFIFNRQQFTVKKRQYLNNNNSSSRSSSSSDNDDDNNTRTLQSLASVTGWSTSVCFLFVFHPPYL